MFGRDTEAEVVDVIYVRISHSCYNGWDILQRTFKIIDAVVVATNNTFTSVHSASFKFDPRS